MQKLACFVDESGQDSGSKNFIVVAVITEEELQQLRSILESLEKETGLGKRKWHKSSPDKRLNFLQTILRQQIAHGEVFFASYQKPLPYFLPMLETIEKGLKEKAEVDCRIMVTVDGIDRKKSIELTNALRLRGIHLPLVRSARDESEPLLRLADRWVGCVRCSLTNPDGSEATLIKEALKTGHLTQI